MKCIIKNLGSAVLVLALAAVRPALADEQNLQIGYVFNNWTSDSLYHGSESRVPLSYTFTTTDFGLHLNTAFVAGNYQQDGIAAQGIPAFLFNSSQFSDSTIGMNLDFKWADSVKSSLVGSLNIPTGDTTWESKEQLGSIPYIFEPSFYHGRGWGGNFFYNLDLTSPGFELGMELGYMVTSTYDTGILEEGTYYPGDMIAAMGTLGFRMSGDATWAFRAVHTFPQESTNSDPSQDFTAGQSTILTSQWASKMGKDKLVINISYSLYNKGFGADPQNVNNLIENTGDYFGDRLEIHPILGYMAGKDVSMETGLIWEKILPNGYPDILDPNHQGGGNLFGLEQSLTFQLDSKTFWNFAGLYHYIANEDEGVNQATINYQRLSLGTNVGLKW